MKADLAADSLFCTNVASETEIKEAAKLKYHRILPRKRFEELLVKASKSEKDERFDHVEGFKAFLGKHVAGIEVANRENKKRARNAIKKRNNTYMRPFTIVRRCHLLRPSRSRRRRCRPAQTVQPFRAA